MDDPSSQKPRIESIDTGCRILNTVEYKGRALYSRYNPAKAIENGIAQKTFLSGTLVVICSPVLWYGFEKLSEKLPENCTIMALEEDKALFELARHSLPEGVAFFLLSETKKIDEYVRALCKTGTVKRLARLDFSGGVYFAKDKYDYTIDALNNIITTFWKNRVTLIKFSRIYSKNFLRNLPQLEKHPMLDDVSKSVERPILVLAAGESLDALLSDDGRRKKLVNAFYIIAVDAALKPLLERGIEPDACVSMESQSVIKEAFIGAKSLHTTFFLDLCSCPGIRSCIGTNIVYFASRYEDSAFFDRLLQENIIPSYVPPLGSVGLAAVYIALTLRESEEVCILVGGGILVFPRDAHMRKALCRRLPAL